MTAHQLPFERPSTALDEVIAGYLAALDAGQRVARDELLERHPEHATALETFFRNHDAAQALARPFQPVAQAAALGLDAAGDLPTLPGSAAHRPGVAALPVGRHFGQYEILSEIARGGMGVVFKTRQVALDRVVALKMILAGQLATADDVARFRTEAQAAAALRHPHIVAIHDVGEHEGQHYFTMDYIDGPSLAEIVRDCPLPARRAAGYVTVIARAIHFAHQQGILHRDLKPSNILIDAADKPHVTDFGLAKRQHAEPHARSSAQTGTGQILGTPSYMPPEQASGARRAVGPPADVYSLGAVLYELVTGRPPFRAESPVDTLLQVLATEPVRPGLMNPGVPRDIETICLKCLEKDPSRRFASADELADDLDRYLRGEPIKARPIGPVARAARWCRRNLAVAMLGLGIVLALLGGLVGVVAQRTRAHVEAAQHLRVRQISQIAAEDKTYYYELENGLTVLIRPVAQSRDAALVLLFGVGEDHSPVDLSGLCLVTARVGMTAATAGRPQRTVEEWVQRHPKGWNLQVGDRYTVVASVFEPAAMAEELADAAARMEEPRQSPSDLERERSAALHASNAMYDGAPQLVARNLARSLLHPRAGSGRPGGALEHLAAIKPEHVETFWRRYFKPANATLVLAGNVDPWEARRLIEERFARIPPGETALGKAATLAPGFGQAREVRPRFAPPGALGEACVALRPPDANHALFPAFLILAARLHQHAGRFAPAGLEAQPLADYPVLYAPLDDPGILVVRSRLAEGEKPKAAVSRLQRALAEIVEPGLQPGETDRAQRTFGFLFGTQPLADDLLLQNLYGTAFRIGRRVQLAVSGAKLAAAIDAVTADELRQAAAMYFAREKQVSVVAQVP